MQSYLEKTISLRYTHSNVHSSVIYIVKIWKPPKCLSTDECIKKIWRVHDTENYSAIKKNEIMLSETTWIGLEIITQMK